MLIGAIDPGLSGAVAFLNTETSGLMVHDIPVHKLTRNGKAKSEIDVASLIALIEEGYAHGAHMFVERVGAMPDQGVSSVFSFGKTFGLIIGIVSTLRLPMTLVAPVTWKKRLRVPAVKDGARARASELLPEHAALWRLKGQHGRAEAALIALYGAQESVK